MLHLINNAEKMAHLVETVGEDDARLAEKWKGMTPYQVAELMREEFIDRFLEKYFPPPYEQSQLHRCSTRETIKPKSNSWLHLDDSLKLAARHAENDFDALTFWDHMRFIASYLKADPGLRARRALMRLQERKDADFSKIYGMCFCQFCWRSILAYGPIRNRYFCQEHWLSSRSAEYVARNRLRKKLCNDRNALKFYTKVILNRLKGLEWGDIQQSEDYSHRVDLYNSQKHKLVEAWANLRISYPGHVFLALPFVQNFLQEKNVDLSSIPEIVHGLESPSPINDTKLEDLRRRYYKDFEFYFHEYYPTLALAEAWMLLEAECKHGGTRPGAGRKKKG